MTNAATTATSTDLNAFNARAYHVVKETCGTTRRWYFYKSTFGGPMTEGEAADLAYTLNLLDL